MVLAKIRFKTVDLTRKKIRLSSVTLNCRISPSKVMEREVSAGVNEAREPIHVQDWVDLLYESGKGEKSMV